MTEIPNVEHPRIWTQEQMDSLAREISSAVGEEKWADAANSQRSSVEAFIVNGINMIQKFEQATFQTHPKINLDTDIIYIDSGPGPYSYNMLEPGKTDLDDVNYHKWPWSRKMDRARIRAAYVIAEMVTAGRIKEQTGIDKPVKDLTPEDFEQYGPYLMYASVDWQQSHIRHVHQLVKEAGMFKIPDSKIIAYEKYTNRQGQVKPIVNTEDQVEGLHFPPFDANNPPRRIVMVSHPAHLMRIMHILGKYPDSIPGGTKLQLFPIPTPTDAVTEYAKAEILGALGTVFRKDRATLEPYTNYEL